MKHAIFNRLPLAALLLAGGAALQAQDAKPSFGVAVSLVNPMGDLAKEPAVAGPGFSLGAFYEMPLTAIPGLSVRGTVEYAMFGGKETEYKYDDYSYKISYSLSHFGVVADALYYFDEPRSFYGLAGVGFYNRPLERESGGDSKSEALDDSMGINLGAGYWFTKNLGAEFKYIMPFGADEDVDTSWLQLSLRWRF